MKKAAFWTVSRRPTGRRGRRIPSAGREALRTSVLAFVLALGAAMIWPAQSEAQLQCLLCHQMQVETERGFVWIHWFDLDSGSACEQWPDTEMCRACGGDSECHDENEESDAILGRCHQSCTPVFALRDLDRAVTVLAAQLDSQTGPILAGRVAEEESLVYDAMANAVELVSCEGVVKRWALGESARSYFTTHHDQALVEKS